MATYRRQTTGPDLTVPRRPLHECPIRSSAAQQPWQPRGLSLWYRTWLTYSGASPLPDETEPDWEDAIPGVWPGATVTTAQNGRVVTIHIEFAGRMEPYQLVWTKRTENLTPPASPTDDIITTEFLNDGPHEIELASTTGKRVSMLVSGSLGQVNYFMP